MRKYIVMNDPLLWCKNEVTGMDVNQPDGGIVVMQKSEYPIVQQIEGTGSLHDSVSLKIPGATEELCMPARCTCGGGTLACSAYRSVRQLEAPEGE